MPKPFRPRTDPVLVVRRPTPEMLRAAAAAYLDRQRVVLWGQAWAILDEDRDSAVDWLSDVVGGVLELASTAGE